MRKRQNNFHVVLSEIGLGMNVLSTRTNGFRDIQVSAAVGGYSDTIEFKFVGRSYGIVGRTSELIGAQLPNTLSGYEIHKPLVQLPGQNSEVIRAQARDWLWRRWEMHKRSYLKLKTHDDADEETVSYFIAPNATGEWEMTIQVYRIVKVRGASSFKRDIIERQLLVAAEVQRVEPNTDGLHTPRIILKSETAAESKYRLQFLDYASRAVAIL